MIRAPRPRGGRRRPLTTIAGWLTALAMVVVGVWFALLTMRGGELLVVESPSMARTAPVGTLVVSERVPPQDLRVGDVISFRPPGVDRVYTHRIVEVTAQGLRTKGDLNSAVDGWTVPTSRVVGRASHLWFGLGWLLKMLPWLVGGGLLTVLAGWWAKPRHQAAIRIAGSSMAVSLALMMVRPLVRAETTGFVPVGKDGVRMSVIGTGLLPIRATSLDKKSVDVVPGQLGWIETHQADAHGRYQVIPHLHLPWWGWALMVLLCLGPFIASLLVRLPDEGATTPTDPPAPEDGAPDHVEPTVPLDDLLPSRGATAAGATRRALRRATSRIGRPAVALGSSLVLALAITPTQSALTASVANSTDTVATRTFFSCLDAMQFYRSDGSSAPTHNGQLYAGYTMGNGTGVAGTTDQQPSTSMGSGSPYTAQPVPNPPTQTTNVGCLSDYQRRAQNAVTFDGATTQWNLPLGSSTFTTNSDPSSDNRMTWNLWIRTSTTNGGVLSCPSASANDCDDRVTWMNNGGRICFGVGSTLIISPNSYNDGKWHMVTTQLDAKNGMSMWVDATLVASNSGTKTGNSGLIYAYPQWGYADKQLTSTWQANWPTKQYFAGDLQMAALFGPNATGVQLQQADITAIYQSAQP